MSLANYEVRDYQEKLFQECIKRNSIIYLPTGSGKTFIALKVINHFVNELNQPLDQCGKRAVFLVNTVYLAMQHKETITDILDMKVACWTSETKKKTWSKARYVEEFESHQVIVATAQLFLDAIKHSFLSISQINVMVFDECHHGENDHPYHELMKQFQYVEPHLHPRIIGLSGMLIGISSSITPETVEDKLKTLQATFQSSIITVNKIQEYRNVLLYSTNPNESYVRYKSAIISEMMKDLFARVDSIRWELSFMKIGEKEEKDPKSLNPVRCRKLKDLSLLFENIKCLTEDMGLFGGYLSLKAIRVQFGLAKQKQDQNVRLTRVIGWCIDHTDNLIKEFEELNFNDLTAEEIFENSSPKVQALIKLLILQFLHPECQMDLQCLIFVKRRYTAKCLYHLLKLYADKSKNFPIKPDFVVGINSELPESIDDLLSLSSNKFALQRFSEKITNCICTSAILEEGIDLQMCNLVIMYDSPTTLRSFVQTMGRARVRNSDYIVLLNADDAERFLSKRNQFHEVDIKLKQLLIKKAIDREISQEDIERERMEVWEPLFTRERALVNNLSAVSLLNRFLCKYTNVNTLFSKETMSDGKFVAKIAFPPQLKIPHTIDSEPFYDIKMCKQNAAFKACELLYEMELLDQHLMPKYF